MPPTICFVDDDPKELQRFRAAFSAHFDVVCGHSVQQCAEQLHVEGKPRRVRLWVLDMYFPAAGTQNTPEQREEMNRRFAELTRVRQGFESFLAQLGQGPTGGLEALREVRRQTPNVPVVFLTRKGTLGDAIAARDAGADAVLIKPQPPAGDDPEALDAALAEQAEPLAARFAAIIEQHQARSRRRQGLAVLITFALGVLAGWLLHAALR